MLMVSSVLDKCDLTRAYTYSRYIHALHLTHQPRRTGHIMATVNISHSKDYVGFCTMCGRNDDKACKVLKQLQFDGTAECRYCHSEHADGAMIGRGEPWLICAGCVDSRMSECDGADEYRILWEDSRTITTYQTLTNETAFAVDGPGGHMLVTLNKRDEWEAWHSTESHRTIKSSPYLHNAIKAALWAVRDKNASPYVR